MIKLTSHNITEVIILYKFLQCPKTFSVFRNTFCQYL